MMLGLKDIYACACRGGGGGVADKDWSFERHGSERQAVYGHGVIPEVCILTASCTS